ncbi:hypothetical protein Ancab_007964 [Ancistrocladus abbreviatus]
MCYFLEVEQGYGGNEEGEENEMEMSMMVKGEGEGGIQHLFSFLSLIHSSFLRFPPIRGSIGREELQHEHR